jgi:CubicO group peptidase (beta-lactamase class C family)
MRGNFRFRIVLALAAVALVGGTPVGAQTFKGVGAVAVRGVTEHVYPGAVVLVGRRDTVLLDRGYGHLTWSSRSAVPSPLETRWDIASLTKVVATTGVAARFVDRGVLDLDAPVRQYLPECAGGQRDAVTVRMLLNHTSGLPAWIPLWKEASTPGGAMALICSVPLRHAPGTTVEYSDLNAILLGSVLVRVGHAPLDSLVVREVIEPLGLARTGFVPDSAARAHAAPTTSNGKVLRGTVNDENAAFLGGVAGHAGLFSTAADLGRVARAWLGQGTLDGGTWVSAGTIALFLSPSGASGTRLLGWEVPDTTGPERSAYGRHPDRGTYGHTGWTGTQIWIDPARDLFVVFVTNRSYEPRVTQTFQALRRVRSRLADAVLGAVPCPAGSCTEAVPREGGEPHADR